MKVIKKIWTKVFKKNGYWVLLNRANDQKYKLFYKSKNKQDVLARREQLKNGSIPFKNRNYMDIRLDELTHYKLMVISKQLNQKSLDKTVNDLIDKAHADCIKQSA
tara:strand:+ start:207 stop:524 length:318 start_codon:yes stop_codon:yes gene_type:complete